MLNNGVSDHLFQISGRGSCFKLIGHIIRKKISFFDSVVVEDTVNVY